MAGLLRLGVMRANLPAVALMPRHQTMGRIQIGIQIGPVRDEMMRDLDATLGKVAEIGYKTFAPSGFSGIDPTKYRAMLDSFRGLSLRNIDSAISTGPIWRRTPKAVKSWGSSMRNPAQEESWSWRRQGTRRTWSVLAGTRRCDSSRRRTRRQGAGRGRSRADCSGDRGIREADRRRLQQVRAGRRASG